MDTLVSLAGQFPLLGPVRDLHPLADTHASQTKYLTNHPYGKIRLLNDRLIEDYYVTHRMHNDYETNIRYYAPQSACDLFVDNAHFLFKHRYAILHDSRMFLAPLYMKDGMAYTGGMGFQRPILGGYIEWWCTCSVSRVYGQDGSLNLLYLLAGSPLSGSNNCWMVGEDGVRKEVHLMSFGTAWRTFTGINTRYEPLKTHYVYSLERVIEILKQKGNSDL